MFFLIACFVQHVYAIPVESINAKHNSPIAPQGGVMLVQLFSDEVGSNWPESIDVHFADGTVRRGVVGWMEKNPAHASWTKNPFRIRPVKQSDAHETVSVQDNISGPVLLVPMPKQKSETVSFGGCVLTPQWHALPESFPALNINSEPVGLPMSYTKSDASPEQNPLEFWRWSLIASIRNQPTPNATFQSEVELLAASYSEDMWKIGFDLLAKSSRSVAATCRDLLTQTAKDGEHEFACWIADQHQLNTLLAIMFEPSITHIEKANRCLYWAEQQQPYLYWIEQVFGNDVQLAFANPTLEPILAAITWQETDSIPIAIEVLPKHTSRESYERLPWIDPSIFGTVTKESQLQWLSVQIGKQTTTQPIVQSKVVVRTPGVLLPPLHPSWSLDSIRSKTPATTIDALRTTVEVRKLMGKWELFINLNREPLQLRFFCHGSKDRRINPRQPFI